MTGIRAAESPRRKEQWKLVSYHFRSQAYVINPILDWTDEEVWEFIRSERLPYCDLYDEGFKRLGCIGCPLATHKNRVREFHRWPRFTELWMRAVRLIWENKVGTLNTKGDEWWPSRYFKSWEEWFSWIVRGGGSVEGCQFALDMG